ncbi:MAG TPA: VCBS repeat-containing protein [Chthonomonadales bacterium]|nr:VCBS repeat-containing protein [Chthonomonadales bacterium]
MNEPEDLWHHGILDLIGDGCALLNVDNDGNLDNLLVGPKLALYKGNGKGQFRDVTEQFELNGLHGRFLGCEVGDYDHDGDEDIYLTAYHGGALLHNEAGKRFKDVTKYAGIKPQSWGTSAAFADIDGDGLLDLYVADYVQFDSRSAQACLFNHHQTECAPITYPPIKGELYRNLGNGRFQDVSARWGADNCHGRTLGVAFADYDQA